MGKDFELYLESLKPVLLEGDLFNHGLIEILGKDKGDRAISEINLYNQYKKFPDELEKNIVLNEVKMTYNREAKAYLSEGMIGLGNILKTEIFRYVKGTIQLKKQRGKDILDIYLAVSSNDLFNNDIKALKGKNKKMKVESGPSYRFDATSVKKKDDFLRKMKQIGAIIEEEEKKEE
jgi:hypothetical protein